MKRFRFVITQRLPADVAQEEFDLHGVYSTLEEAYLVWQPLKGVTWYARYFLMTWSLDEGVVLSDFASKERQGYENYHQLPSLLRDKVKGQIFDWIKQVLRTDPLRLA